MKYPENYLISSTSKKRSPILFSGVNFHTHLKQFTLPGYNGQNSKGSTAPSGFRACPNYCTVPSNSISTSVVWSFFRGRPVVIVIVVSFTSEWKIMQISVNPPHIASAVDRRTTDIADVTRRRKLDFNPHCLSPTIKSIIRRDKFHLHAASMRRQYFQLVCKNTKGQRGSALEKNVIPGEIISDNTIFFRFLLHALLRMRGGEENLLGIHLSAVFCFVGTLPILSSFFHLVVSFSLLLTHDI